MSATGVNGPGNGAGGEGGAVLPEPAETGPAGVEPERTEPAEAGEDKPRGRSPGLWWWPRRRSMALDVFLALLSALECAVEGAIFAGRLGMPGSVFALFGLAAGATLVLRRRWPVAVVLVSLAVSPAQTGYILGSVGLYTLAASAVPRRITFSLAGLTTTGTFVVTVLDMYHEQQARPGLHVPMIALVLTALTVAIGLTVAPLLLGLYIGARRRLVESLVERADGLERELALLADKAIERANLARIEERTRIAREMHDVVAHRVSLMVVHAAALQTLIVRDPDKAVRNAGLIGDMGRQALDELRTMLGVLRANHTRPDQTAADRTDAGGKRRDGGGRPGRDERQAAAVPAAGSTAQRTENAAPSHGAGPGPGGTAASDGQAEPETPHGGPAVEEREQQPDSGPVLSDVAKLVEESRAAGMVVRLSIEGEERPLKAEAGRTAYRVVQEALTNVHKHAPGAEALVRVAYRPQEVAVLVENGPSDGRPSAALPSGGNGLIGMRERVLALGGGFVAGPKDGGGFRVSALLPDRR